MPFNQHGSVVARLAERYLTARSSGIDSVWVTQARKAWKGVVTIPPINDAFDALEYLDSVQDYIDALAEDLLFNKGLYTIPKDDKIKSIPQRLKDKVIGELRAAREKVEDTRRKIRGTRERLDPGSPSHKLDGGYLLKWYQEKDPRSPMRLFHQHVRTWIEEDIAELDSIMSRKMFGALTRYLNKYNQDAIEAGSIDLVFSVGKVKVIYQDFPGAQSTGGPLSTIPRTPLQIEQSRFPQPDQYARPLDIARQLLARHGLDFLWYGDVYIRCKSCGGENPYGAKFGVGAHYITRTDHIQIYADPSPGLAKLMIHELGHRYYYRFMDQQDRAKFDSYFAGSGATPEKIAEVLDRYVDVMRPEDQRLLRSVGLYNRPDDIQYLVRRYYDKLQPADQQAVKGWLRGVPATSEYGQTISSEDFAEVFASYVTGKNLTRDQVERFKAFLGRTRRTASSKWDKSVGAEPWKAVPVPGRGKLWTEPHDSEEAFPPAIASYEVLDGWLVYKGRNGSEGIVVGSPAELQKWITDVHKFLDIAPEREAVAWTPEHGGQKHVDQALRVASAVLRALGVTADIRIMVKERADAQGHASGSVLTLVNVHTGGRRGSYIGGISIPTHLQVAAHEAAHLGYDRGGRKVLEALREHLRAGGDYLSAYHSVAGDFEGVMEAAALYALAPRDFERAAPGVFAATREWFGGKKIRV